MFDITIDGEKCRDAFTCRRCLGICPVLTVYPEKGSMLAKNVRWRVSPTFSVLCTGCGKCAEICPPGAIKLKPD